MTLNAPLLIKTFFLCVIFFFSTPCRAEISTQKQLMPIEDVCDELSKLTDEEFFVVSGVVFQETLSLPLGDCHPKKCLSQNLFTNFEVYLDPIKTLPNYGEKVLVLTPIEYFPDINNLKGYFEEGKAYTFCAYKKTYEDKLKQNAFGKLFHVDISTIRQLN